MARQKDGINPALYKQLLLTLAQSLVDLKEINEAAGFLEDFLKADERKELATRLGVVYWLRKKRDKENIKRNLKVSDKQFQEGMLLLKRKGVKLALKKIEAEEWANVWERRIKKLVKK